MVRPLGNRLFLKAMLDSVLKDAVMAFFGFSNLARLSTVAIPATEPGNC
jgi:hypothetical protein